MRPRCSPRTSTEGEGAAEQGQSPASVARTRSVSFTCARAASQAASRSALVRAQPHGMASTAANVSPGAPGSTMPSAVEETTPRHNIGDAGMYLGWQQNRQIGGAVAALASRFTRIRGPILLPRRLHAGVTHHGSCRHSMIGAAAVRTVQQGLLTVTPNTAFRSLSCDGSTDGDHRMSARPHIMRRGARYRPTLGRGPGARRWRGWHAGGNRRSRGGFVVLLDEYRPTP